MTPVYGTSEDEKGKIIGYWMGKMIGKAVHPPYSAIGWLNERDSLVAAVLFNDYNGSNVEATFYGPGHVTRQIMRQTISYAFEQLGCQRLTAKVRRHNARMRKLLTQGRGFVFEARLKHFFGPARGDDALVYRMEREAAQRWMK